MPQTARPESAPETDAADLPFSLPLDLTITDHDTIEQLWAIRDGAARDEFALAALRIGVLALKQA